MTFPDLWGNAFNIASTSFVTGLPTTNTVVLRDGWIVTTWMDPNDRSMKGQIQNADGSRFGEAFTISDAGAGGYGAPVVTAMPDGLFIVVYETVKNEEHSLIQTTFDVFAGKLDSNVIATKPKTSSSLNPSIQSFNDGSFYVSYTDNGLKYFRYSNGVASNGTLETNANAKTIGKGSVSQDRFALLAYVADAVPTLYLNIFKSDATLLAHIPIRSNIDTPTAFTSSIATLSNGNFVVLFEDYNAQTKEYILKATILTPQGVVVQTSNLATNDRPYKTISVTALSGADFAFAYYDKVLLNKAHLGTYHDGVVEQRAMAVGVYTDFTLKTLNDGRFMVSWTDNDLKIIKGQIYDPRTSAVDWHGGDVGQQYAGTKFGDHLHGGTGLDTLFGGAGDDVLEGGGGGDWLDGGSGWDVATYLNTSAQDGGIVVDLSTNQNGGAAAGDVLLNIEVVEGTNQADTITGLFRENGNGVELHGEGGDDHLIGKEDGDRLYGGDGNDWLSGGEGPDTLDGGADWDVVSYLGAASGIVVDLTTNQNGGAAAGDVLLAIEVVEGTNQADLITGLNRGGGHGVELSGKGGNDRLIGKEGGDRLYGGDDDDVLIGGGGPDTLDGGSGIDTAVFTSARQGYTITKNADGTYTVTGQDGTDLLKDVEFARFDDRTVSPADMAESQNPDILTFADGTNAKSVQDDDLAPALGTLKADDPDDPADTLTFSIDATDQNNGKFTIVGGNVLAVSNGTLNPGAYTVKVKVSDTHGGWLVKDFTITSMHVNAAPIVDEVKAYGSGMAGSGDDAGKILITEDTGPLTIAMVKAHDPDGGTIKYELATNPNGIFTIGANGNIGIADPTALRVTQDTDYTLVVKISDGQGGVTNQDVKIKVKDVNQAPVIDNLSGNSVNEDKGVGTEVGTVTAHDPEDGQAGLVFALKDAQGNAADAGGLFAVDATGHLTVAKALTDATGDQTFQITLRVSDKNGGAGSLSTFQTFTITVKDVVAGNHAPDTLTLNGGTIVNIDENAAFEGNLSAHDDDNDTNFTWTFDNAVTGNANALFEIDNSGSGTKTLKLKAGVSYEDLPAGQKFVLVALKASDGKQGGTSATQVFKINVADVDETTAGNHAPTGLSLSGAKAASEYAAAGTLVGALTATDADNNALSYTLLDNAGGRFVLSGSSLLVADGFRLDFEQAKSHTVTVQVADGHGGVATQTFAIAVTDINPEITAGSGADDVFKGGAKNDKLGGGVGNDRLWGGLGNDQLSGGKGRDTFVFDTKFNKAKNKDLIKDYSVKDDAIWLDNALFKANKALYAATKKGTEAKPVKLASKFFSLDHAKDKDDFFVYDTHRHVLSYDADGAGAKAGVAIAGFTNNKALKAFTHKELFFF